MIYRATVLGLIGAMTCAWSASAADLEAQKEQRLLRDEQLRMAPALQYERARLAHARPTVGTLRARPEGLDPRVPNDTTRFMGMRWGVGLTYYDWQSNANAIKRVEVDGDGNVDVVWTQGVNPVLAINRHVAFNRLTPITGSPDYVELAVGGLLIENRRRSGFVSLALVNDDTLAARTSPSYPHANGRVAAPAFDLSPPAGGPIVHSAYAIDQLYGPDPSAGSGAFGELDSLPLDMLLGCDVLGIWPHVAANADVASPAPGSEPTPGWWHALTENGGNDTTCPGVLAAGENYVWYTRGHYQYDVAAFASRFRFDSDMDGLGHNTVKLPDQVAGITGMVAASRVPGSNRTAIGYIENMGSSDDSVQMAATGEQIYPTFNYRLKVWVSEDGHTWDWAHPAWMSHRLPDPDFDLATHRLGSLGDLPSEFYLFFDHHDSLHVAWTTHSWVPDTIGELMRIDTSVDAFGDTIIDSVRASTPWQWWVPIPRPGRPDSIYIPFGHGAKLFHWHEGDPWNARTLVYRNLEHLLLTCNSTAGNVGLGAHVQTAWRPSLSEDASGRIWLAFDAVWLPDDWSHYLDSTLSPEVDCAGGTNGCPNADVLVANLGVNARGYHALPDDVDQPDLPQIANVTRSKTPACTPLACASETDPSLSEYADDWLTLTYIFDTDAGSFLMNEGTATNDPVVVQRIPITEDAFLSMTPERCALTGMSLLAATHDTLAWSAVRDPRAPEVARPLDFALGYAAPNPFNPSATITFRLARAGHATLAVRDIMGHTLVTLANADYSAGTHRVVWDGSDAKGHAVASGVYLYALTVGGQTAVRRMTLQK